jgi:hypothetical protein
LDWLIPQRLDFEEFRRDKFFFYFTQLGEYPRPGTDTATLKQMMQPYVSIPGVADQLKALEDIEPIWGSENAAVMGRRFEIERAHYYAQNRMLSQIRPWNRTADLTVTGPGTIRYVQVKWSVSAMDAETASSVVRQAQNIGGQGEFLLESTKLSGEAIAVLVRGGGRPLP